MTQPVASVVIPAHNEEKVIGRLLDALLDGVPEGEFDIVVVCNGCEDGTASVAASRGSSVTVVETPKPSKHDAMRLGDRHTAVFPRVYVDADVEIGAADIRLLAAAVDSSASPVLAAAPERELPLRDSSWPVRWFYGVWVRIPGVRDGLYGRGVIMLSEDGWKRVTDLPPMMGDDLAASEVFAADERRVVREASVVIRPPRTWGDLIRRRTRAVTATAQFGQSGAVEEQSRTSKADLVAILKREPWRVGQVALFVGVALIARRAAARAVASGDFTTWLRDESSRG
jgi:glycosyltransferase involved in cell wall biosynthesis